MYLQYFSLQSKQINKHLIFANQLQPDVVAPGVNILASWSPALPLSTSTGPVHFNIESGTSMACPHVSAIVAILKSVHPTWSPAALKSALVTTGKMCRYTKNKIINIICVNLTL